MTSTGRCGIILPTTPVSISSLAVSSYIDHGGNFGFGTKTPLAKLHVVGTGTVALIGGNTRIDGECRATTYNVNGTVGFTGTGGYTNFTIVSGIITAAS